MIFFFFKFNTAFFYFFLPVSSSPPFSRYFFKSPPKVPKKVVSTDFCFLSRSERRKKSLKWPISGVSLPDLINEEVSNENPGHVDRHPSSCQRSRCDLISHPRPTRKFQPKVQYIVTELCAFFFRASRSGRVF